MNALDWILIALGLGLLLFAIVVNRSVAAADRPERNAAKERWQQQQAERQKHKRSL